MNEMQRDTEFMEQIKDFDLEIDKNGRLKDPRLIRKKRKR